MSVPAKFTKTAQCPSCQSDIYFYSRPRLGEFVTCPECEDLVEVVNLTPLTLDWSADMDDDEWEDDWDDDGDEYDDYDDFDDYDD